MRSKKSKRSYKVDHPVELIENIDIPDFLGELETWFSGIAEKISNFNKGPVVTTRPYPPRNQAFRCPHSASVCEEFVPAGR